MKSYFDEHSSSSSDETIEKTNNISRNHSQRKASIPKVSMKLYEKSDVKNLSFLNNAPERYGEFKDEKDSTKY